MFEKFPKHRIQLPEEFQVIYKEQYKSNREGQSKASGLAQKMESWLHKKVAADVDKKHSKKTLEIGAGTLNQLQYEQSEHYDIVEPFSELYADSPYLPAIKNKYTDISQVDEKQYDRITSVAALEHIEDLPKVIAQTCLLLKEDGVLRSSIPNEGTFLWKLGWKMTTGLEFRLKHGLDYGILMEYEHVNTAKEIDEILNYFYVSNTCKTFGIGKGFALYRFYESKVPRIDAAEQYLNSI